MSRQPTQSKSHPEEPRDHRLSLLAHQPYSAGRRPSDPDRNWSSPISATAAETIATVQGVTAAVTYAGPLPGSHRTGSNQCPAPGFNSPEPAWRRCPFRSVARPRDPVLITPSNRTLEAVAFPPSHSSRHSQAGLLATRWAIADTPSWPIKLDRPSPPSISKRWLWFATTGSLDSRSRAGGRRVTQPSIYALTPANGSISRNRGPTSCQLFKRKLASVSTAVSMLRLTRSLRPRDVSARRWSRVRWSGFSLDCLLRIDWTLPLPDVPLDFDIARDGKTGAVSRLLRGFALLIWPQRELRCAAGMRKAITAQCVFARTAVR